MKNVLLAIMILFAFTACNQSGEKSKKEKSISENSFTVDNSIVNVYYFHGKQRCKTCIAVGNVAQEAVEKNFKGNDNVNFTELNTTEAKNKELIEKYDVSWNALIISKGEEYRDITDDAFATAVGNPEKLSENIVSIVESMLQGQ